MGLNLVCGRCGYKYSGHGSSLYCGGCRPIVVRQKREARRLKASDPLKVGWSEFRASVLRGRSSKLAVRNKDLLGFDEAVYRSLVGSCVYCGDGALGLARKDLGKPWLADNCVCACGVCGRAKAGLSHSEFSSLVLRIAGNLTKED